MIMRAAADIPFTVRLLIRLMATCMGDGEDIKGLNILAKKSHSVTHFQVANIY
jgi:hypothetical protein